MIATRHRRRDVRPASIRTDNDVKPGDDVDLSWDADLIKQVADEASPTPVKTKKQLKSVSWFNHFHCEWDDELPDGEEFKSTDYYLFENIARKRWLRSQLNIQDDDMAIPEAGETVLFKWVFHYPRGKTADDNQNVFDRHENIAKWDAMKRYDDAHGTNFAARFDVKYPDSASMRSAPAPGAQRDD